LLGASSDELAGYDNRLALLDAALRFGIVRNSETLHARLLAETESADDSVLSADPVDGALAKLEVEAGIEAVASSRPEHPPPKKASRSPKPRAQPVEVDPVPSFEEPPKPARVRAAPISEDEGAAVISTLAALFGLGDSGEPDPEPPQEALDGPTVVEPSAAFQPAGTELDDLLDLAQETEEQDTLRSITVPANGAGAAETQPEEAPATAAEPPLVDDSLRDVFIEEAALLFDGLSADLVQLEQTPNDPEPLARALRAVHTLKGSSATVGYGKIRALTTLMEDVLRKAGEKNEVFNPDAVAVLLAATEGVETLMREITGSGRELTANAAILDQLQTVLGQFEPTPDGSVNSADQSQPRVIAEVGGSEASLESDSLRAIFVQEAQGILEVLSRDLVALENGSTAMDTVHRALRGAHSLKGSAAMLGFAGMRTLSHAMEDGLQVIRDGQISASSETIDLMLDAVDALEIAVEAVEQNGKEPRNQKFEQ
jgi:HPt (histidine-containing phosphotransfer) domain-containing protein